MAASATTDSSEIVVPQGPFGGPGGVDDFYDGVGDVVEIVVTYSDVAIYSVQTTYQQGATKLTTGQHGKQGLKTFPVIKLDFPAEYLMQVKGTRGTASGYDAVMSLTFITNKGTYGPIGVEGDHKFQSSPQGKVMGFFGKTGAVLDSIGVLTTFLGGAVSAEGPWGGNGGNLFYDGRADKIVGIDVEYTDDIVSLTVKYAQGSRDFQTLKHGGSGPDKGPVQKLVFESDEYLTQVTGTLNDNSKLVSSLKFITNKKSYGPYGKHKGREFQTSPNAEVLGFFGRWGWKLDQLGAFVRMPSLPVFAGESWGGNGGKEFYDGRGKIDQITVVHTEFFIYSLQVTYLQGGEPFQAPKHGTAKGESKEIKLRPDEHMVQVRGTYGPGREQGTNWIRSLQFFTNKRKFGPYGDTNGTSFTSKQGTVVGFFGRSAEILDRLGFIVVPTSSKSD